MTIFSSQTLFSATCIISLFIATAVTSQSATGIVSSVVKAPISPDGDVAGAVTDFVINLAVDMNPSVPGKILTKGESIHIKLPASFTFSNEANYPLQNLLSAAECKPGLIKCSTGVLLHGWPQHPILPSFPPGKVSQYSLTYEPSSNTIIYTANKDFVDLPFKGPGVKQAHLLLFGFVNPKQPGNYPIGVSLHDKSGKERESGVGDLVVRADIAPSINVTSVFVPGDKKGGLPPNPNTIYQKAEVGKPAPMPWDFLMWNTDGKAYAGVEIEQENGDGGTLVHNGKTVGKFGISSPKGAKGQSVSGGPSVRLPATPVIGKSFGAPIPVGRLTAMFTAGSAPGRYTTTFELDGGNSVTMIVDVSAGG
jgi:hypothetical protein